MTRNELIKIGTDTLIIEMDALKRTAELLSESFADAVDMVFACRGRVVVTGMGKSGLIGKKIAATLASTGTPAFFLHPAEGVHGDLGMIVKGDVVIAISNSGETDELKTLLPVIKRLGIGLVSIVGNVESTLARMSDHVLDASIEKEACPLNLAPTASTTVSLALGDALAVALVTKRGFKAEDFALLHPSGTLGKRLLLGVSDVMHMGDDVPVVSETDSFEYAMKVITDKHLGCTAVIDMESHVSGIITDGDLRRAMTKFKDPYSMKARDIMSFAPKLINENDLAASALRIMEEYKISSLLVVDSGGKLKGVLHFQDLLKSGLV